jgi:hypothetical protein
VNYHAPGPMAVRALKTKQKSIEPSAFRAGWSRLLLLLGNSLGPPGGMHVPEWPCERLVVATAAGTWE